MNWRRFTRAVSIAVLGSVLLLAATGCASSRAVRSERRGLFDRVRFVGSAPIRSSSKPSGRTEVSSVSPSRELKRQAHGLSLTWPIAPGDAGRLSSTFGPRGRDFHEGIDIGAKIGTPVYAAQAGTVIYADDEISGYGKLLVIKHVQGFATVYAHNSRFFVSVGDRVKRGQKVALSGNTGRTSGPHLHFEVRKGVAALDPLRLLPRRELASSPSSRSSRRLARK